MELQTVGWILAAWFGFSIVVSLALGWFLREVNASADESELNQVISHRRVVRYLRGKAGRAVVENEADAVDESKADSTVRRAR